MSEVFFNGELVGFVAEGRVEREIALPLPPIPDLILKVQVAEVSRDNLLRVLGSLDICQHQFYQATNGKRHCRDCGEFIGYTPGSEP